MPPIAPPPELCIRNLSKRFGSLVALDQVSLNLTPGSFHALLGENGAGKSTLVKCLMGFYHADTGEILLDGQPVRLPHPRAAQQHGIGMVYQQFTVVPAMTVAENLVLSRLEGSPMIDWRRELAALESFMAIAPFPLPLTVPVSQLAAGEKQKLEILKQLYLQNRILILDEPTSVLTPGEADEVLGLLRQTVTQGGLSVLMISHKLREVMTFADTVTVLRKGQLAGEGRVADLSIAAIAQLMMGERHPSAPPSRTTRQTRRPVLELEGLSADKDSGVPALMGLDLTVQGGEIVGIAGVAGNGQRELVEVLAGQRHPTGGQVRVNGESYQGKRSQAARHQVFCLPEEPLRNACVPQMSVAENLALRTFDRPPQRQGPMLRYGAIRQAAIQLIQLFAIKTPSPDTPIEHLSGGNVQRTVLARELAAEQIQLLITANPCFGLDLGAVADIHGQLLATRNRGVAVLLVSEDLDEILELADRVVVMSGGEFVYDRAIAEVDLATLNQSLVGHSVGHPTPAAA